MTLLSQVKRGKIKKPVLALIYGPDGVGKSTFAADAPGTIFLGTEDGTASLDVARFPAPQKFEDVIQILKELLTEQHSYQTLAIDSLDWLEPMLWDYVCRQNKWQSIEDPGFGKGYVYANKIWMQMMEVLSQLRALKDMSIIVIAHSQVRPFNDPTHMNPYDRYSIKLNEKAAALWREFVDTVLFATFEVHVAKNEQKKTRALGDGKRVLYTERRPSFDAKNRLGLPFEMDLSWDAFIKAAERGAPEEPAEIKKNIQELMSRLQDEDIKKSVVEAVEKAGDNSVRLEQIQNRLRTRLSA